MNAGNKKWLLYYVPAGKIVGTMKLTAVDENLKSANEVTGIMNVIEETGIENDTNTSN